jgi:[protein-PII] uridylyltransferase
MHFAASRKAPLRFVEAFCSGMPSSYWLHHEHDIIREHAEIAWRRGDQPVHVELAPTRHVSAPCISVVTDDRPGLLSLVTAAISAHALDIVSAKIYCRARETVAEAVDFFLVRRLDGLAEVAAIEEAQVGSLRRLITSLLRGETDIESLATRSAQTVRIRRRSHIEVHFDDRRGEADRFTVDADDRPGLLLAITTALFNERVSIQGAEVLTIGGRAHDEFDIVEWNGSPISEQRKAVIAESVAAAVAAIG